MSEPIYKIRKVFDCQWDPGIPEDVKRAFFDLNEFAGNDCYVSWTVQEDDTEYFTRDDEPAVQRRMVDEWLMANGAEGRTEASPYNGETVLIKHWW